ncbi:acyltransferase family protein [Roseomonas sp. CCTCC AB2023176]|uniref:acyltransferase family protein n=1 Tax=Roseomonas sp. CCTCC AB2023176 TaxID=3342640 RepID=UPI0035DFB42B
MQILSIQYLRAIAALMIVVFHAGNQLTRLGLPAGWGDGLQAGVDIFFVISGVIMYVTTAGTGIRPAEFWLRRIIRIVPLYWIMTTAMVAAALLLPGLVRTARFDPAHVLASYLFIAWPHPVLGEALPILVPGWTLNHEMFFYAVFGLALTLPERVRFWAVGAVLGTLVVAAHALPAAGTLLRFHGSGIVLEFWAGMALGRLHLARRLPGPALSGALLVLGLLALPFSALSAGDVPRVLHAGLPAVAVVAGALGLERARRVPRNAFGSLLGEASYALYLSHVMVLPAVAVVWGRIAPGDGFVALVGFVLAGVATSVAVSIAVYRLIEKPLRHAMHLKMPGASRTPSLAAVASRP